MFRNREEAARRLARPLKGRHLFDPLVLAIPRGGVVTGAALARELGAELDVVLSRKLRTPWQPELALGAVADDGHVYLDREVRKILDWANHDLVAEHRHQLAELNRLRELIRRARPEAPITGRSVILTDDGIATGSTMIAALQSVSAHNPYEVIVAVPCSPPDRLADVRDWSDDVVCLLSPGEFGAIAQFYADFAPVTDARVIDLLRSVASGTRRRAALAHA
jgi:predicted phosphoribosyltransferase